MLLNLLIFVKLLFIQVTVSQCLPRSLHQNGQHFTPELQKASRRCTRQTNPLPAELAQTNIPTNGIPIDNAGSQNAPCNYRLPNGLATNNMLQNSLPNNGLIPNINGLNNVFNIPIGNLGLQNSPCHYGLPNSLAKNNILQNSLPLNIPGKGLMPNAYGFNNAINLPVNNGMPFSNDITFSNNIATNNFMPNAYNGPLINSIPSSNVCQNGNVLNANNMPAANFLPNLNIPFANSVSNKNNLSPLNMALPNIPGSIPGNNLVNNNNLPINNILPSGNGMLPNGLANSPQYNMPIANGHNLPANNIFPNSNNVNYGYANLPQNNMPIANGLQNMNNVPIANNFPNINCLNNLPVSNGITGFNNLPTNVMVNNSLPYASKNIPSSNNIQFDGVRFINNPLAISNNVPLHTISPNNNIPVFSNDRFINEGVNAINGMPNSGLLNNNLLLPNNLFTDNLPIANNWPCNNAGVNSALQQNVLQNALPATNVQLENQLGFAKDLASTLQIEGFGNMPLLNGLPIAGITETVTLLNTPCS